jgi:hypothetical protein
MQYVHIFVLLSILHFISCTKLLVETDHKTEGSDIPGILDVVVEHAEKAKGQFMKASVCAMEGNSGLHHAEAELDFPSRSHPKVTCKYRCQGQYCMVDWKKEWNYQSGRYSGTQSYGMQTNL